jgi:hypothetical protein
MDTRDLVPEKKEELPLGRRCAKAVHSGHILVSGRGRHIRKPFVWSQAEAAVFNMRANFCRKGKGTNRST